MRRRGAGLGSPEANFMFGGPYNEQVYKAGDSPLLPYQRGEAAIDSMSDDGTLSGDAAQIIPERDRRIKQISRSILRASEIEEQRSRVAKILNDPELKDS